MVLDSRRIARRSRRSSPRQIQTIAIPRWSSSFEHAVDGVGFVNGSPLVVSELKKPDACAAFDENLTQYNEQTGVLFAFNALLIPRTARTSVPGVAGGDAARDVRLCAPVRLGGESHSVFPAQRRVGEDHRAEPPVPRRERGHRLNARGAGAQCRLKIGLRGGK